MHRPLLADDDRVIRESLKRALQLEGYAVDGGQVQPRLANWTQLCAAT